MATLVDCSYIQQSQSTSWLGMWYWTLVFVCLKGLISLVKSGIIVCALSLKHNYWPAYCQGNVIDKDFVGNKFGDTAV